VPVIGCLSPGTVISRETRNVAALLNCRQNRRRPSGGRDRAASHAANSLLARQQPAVAINIVQFSDLNACEMQKPPVSNLD
jgi:hypothetical protein